MLLFSPLTQIRLEMWPPQKASLSLHCSSAILILKWKGLLCQKKIFILFHLGFLFKLLFITATFQEASCETPLTLDANTFYRYITLKGGYDYEMKENRVSIGLNIHSFIHWLVRLFIRSFFLFIYVFN